MPRSQKGLRALYDRYRVDGPDVSLCRVPVTSLSDYFGVVTGVQRKDAVFWFRGQEDYTWDLTPSALRFPKQKQRSDALDLLSEFRRFAEMRLAKPPGLGEDLKWVQLARHYGLPTRLLDWTRNAAIALYFACLDVKIDGSVFVFNPVDLNRQVDPDKPRVLDAHLDAKLIGEYLRLTGKKDPRGRRTIAVNPVWNSERIMLQQGTFTLHGSSGFTLTSAQATSLVAIPILGGHKPSLRKDLDRVGVNEMSIFPEPEHICNYLKERPDLA